MSDWIDGYDSAYLKLKSYVYFGETDQGVFFEAGANSFVLRGAGLYPIVSKILQHMDNGQSIEQIKAHLPDKLKGLFSTLLRSLHDKNMLHALPGPDSDYVPGQHSLASELKLFAEDQLGSAAASEALGRWQHSRIMLVGQGMALKSCFKALLDSGIRTVDLFWDESVPSRVGRDEVESLIEPTQRAGFQVEIYSRDPTQQDVQAADAVLLVSDHCRTPLFKALQAQAGQQHKPCIVASVFSGRAMCLPEINSDSVGFAEAAYWAALRPEQADLSPAALSILGCIAAQRMLFCALKIDNQAWRHSVSLVSPYLDISTHPLVPVIGAGQMPPELPALSYPDQFQLPDDRELAEYEIYKIQLQPWFDPQLGCLELGNDDAIEQMPLFQFPVRICLPDRETQHVLGWGVNLAESGLMALSHALEVLLQASGYPDQPLVVAFDATQWERQAGARALAVNPEFSQSAPWTWLNPDSLTDAKSQMLLRLLRYRHQGEVKIQLIGLSKMDAYVAQISLGGQWIASASGSSYLEAVQEALGRSCSHFQIQKTGQPGYWKNRLPALEVSAGKKVESLEALLGNDAALPELAIEYVRVNPCGFPPGVYGGYARLKMGGVL
ncbi:hypothetical protein [Bowmanella dokdonensis]|uniref:Thiazole-containing bacteriocin maturation protein n=1 Tax=Bowmanella dokdonensis TaxID=751969 RepID=A0A939IPU7_9ALTE|nr:hypothetical protein [Bowmanella dokdonensis]MBN7823937.1 hypothetical protein [Bowmanella dokdonensis]